MSYSNGLISETGVSIDDVRSVLGASSYNLGILCKDDDGRVNIWAKYKPIKIAGDFINLTNENWWKGSDGNCGLSYQGYPTLALMAAKYDDSDEMNGWSYLHPTGGESSPFRLLDFAGYYHAAKAPFGTFSVAKKVKWEAASSESIDITCSVSPPYAYSLAASDFSVFYDNYFSVYVVKSGDTTFAISADSVFSAGGFKVSIPLKQFGSIGSVKLYPFFSPKAWAIGSVGGTCIPLPKVSPMSCELVSSVIKIVWNNASSLPNMPSSSAFTVNFSIKNEYVDTYTFTKILVITSFLSTFEAANADTSNSHYVTLSGSFTVAGNSSVIKTASIVFSYQSSTVTGGTMIKPQNLFIRAYYGSGGTVDFHQVTPPYISSTPV